MIRPVLFHNILIFSLFSLLCSGCATKETVREDIRASEERQAQAVTELREEFTDKINRLDGMEKDSAEALKLARENNQAMAGLRADFSGRNNLSEKMAETVYFGFDRHDLDDSAKAALDKVAAMMGRDNNYQAVLQGHTDAKGSESYNYALSYRRVAGVIGYLVAEKNADLNRIHLVGLGEGYPAADNSSEDGRQRNRRVDIKVLAPR
ncbi:MAG: OmpA family protein [Desulfurivibrionaceae bacterium]|nr:OmpA family protein [Desulfurivibrionaceae bacterium]